MHKKLMVFNGSYPNIYVKILAKSLQLERYCVYFFQKKSSVKKMTAVWYGRCADFIGRKSALISFS